MTNIRTVTLVLAGSAACLMAGTLMTKDKTFAMKAAQGGMAEVQLGQLATSKASNPKVKTFGQKMVDDHGKANDQLKSIASKENISLPSDVDAKDKALMSKLNNLSGDAFDKAYMKAMVKDHAMDIAEFEKEANSGSDDALKSFASQTLPTLKEHQTMAKDAASAVGAM